MYFPVTYVQPATRAPLPQKNGLGYFETIDPNIEEGEFYPPPYDFLSPRFPAARGMGLFDSSDFSEWGFAEYAAIAAGLYFGVKLMGDFTRGRKAVSGYRKKRAGRRSRRKQLKQELTAI